MFIKQIERNMGKKLVNSYDMKNGESGIVIEIEGGGNLLERLSNIGIRTGKQIRKVCNQPLSGPVQLQVDKTEIALGRGMAQKILVRIISSSTC